ncbi:hypothetical protein ANANG_G00164830 [Anguilla anguilla]|uniref:Senescence domain-containing protein n=1 Tax=Anguilla anguilla TaxID=7936 RepID=A0A9D3MA13_ANGAN|nr:hypothetical protein ANANG_G00164830 [Anguilla anguilla]
MATGSCWFVIKVRYGSAAGQATHSAVDCTVDLGVAAVNFNHLAIKGLTKAAGQQASSAAAESSRPQKKRGKKEEKREE